MSFEWTEENTETLRAMWGGGHSGSEIGNRLGITRSAVIGKAHRLGLAGGGEAPARRSARISHQMRELARKNPKPKRKKTEPTGRRAIVESLLKSAVLDPLPTGPDLVPTVFRLVDLEAHHCRWIPGEVSEGYCGRNRVEGISYCEYHARRAYECRKGHLPRPEFVPKRLHVSGLSMDHAVETVAEFVAP